MLKLAEGRKEREGKGALWAWALNATTGWRKLYEYIIEQRFS